MNNLLQKIKSLFHSASINIDDLTDSIIIDKEHTSNLYILTLRKDVIVGYGLYQQRVRLEAKCTVTKHTYDTVNIGDRVYCIYYHSNFNHFFDYCTKYGAMRKIDVLYARSLMNTQEQNQNEKEDRFNVLLKDYDTTEVIWKHLSNLYKNENICLDTVICFTSLPEYIQWFILNECVVCSKETEIKIKDGYSLKRTRVRTLINRYLHFLAEGIELPCKELLAPLVVSDNKDIKSHE